MPGLTNVEAAIDTVRGTVSSSWSIAGRLLKLDVTIPVNATAEVWVPIHGGSADGFDVHASHGLELDRVEDGFAVFERARGRITSGPADRLPRLRQRTSDHRDPIDPSRSKL